MKQNKLIRLKLGKDWLYFHPQSQCFRPVGNKRNFKAGELLYRDSEFYLVVPKKKLKPITWNHAGKKIYEALVGTSNRRNYQISKNKTLFAFQINDEEEVQTCLKRYTLPYSNGSYPEFLRENPLDEAAPHTPSTDAEKRAKMLLHRIANNNPRFKIRNTSLYVRSKNGKMYRISLINASVYDIKENYVCVTTYNSKNLPLYDIIISKAISIAYAPKRISTL